MMSKKARSELRNPFYKEVRGVLLAARNRVYRAANFAMVQAYWNVGRLVVEEEQRGKARAGYAEFLIPRLAQRLTQDLGRGFTETNLKYFRMFYLAFPGTTFPEIRHTLCDELTWSHYRALTA